MSVSVCILHITLLRLNYVTRTTKRTFHVTSAGWQHSWKSKQLAGQGSLKHCRYTVKQDGKKILNYVYVSLAVSYPRVCLDGLKFAFCSGPVNSCAIFTFHVTEQCLPTENREMRFRLLYIIHFSTVLTQSLFSTLSWFNKIARISTVFWDKNKIKRL